MHTSVQIINFCHPIFCLKTQELKHPKFLSLTAVKLGVTPNAEHKLRLSEIKILDIICGPKNEEVTEGEENYKMRSSITFTLQRYYQIHHLVLEMMDAHVGEGKCLHIFGCVTERTKKLAKSRRRCEDSIDKILESCVGIFRLDESG